MSDPSTGENPTPEDPARGAESTAPAAPPSTPAPEVSPAAPQAPQFVQPYPGAPPVPVSPAPGAPSGAPVPPAAAPAAPVTPPDTTPTAPAPPPSAPPATPPTAATTPLPPYAAAAGYPGAAGGYPGAPGSQPSPGQQPPAYAAGAGVPPEGQYPPPPGQYAPPAGQYAPPGGQYAPPAGQYPPPGGPYPPGSVPPGDPQQPSGPDGRPKTLAIIALCLAIFGGIIAFIPFVNLVSAPVLIAAIVIAIIALVSKKQGGTGFSIAALIVSVVAGLAAVIITIGSIFFATLGGLDGLGDPLPDETATSEPSEEATPSEEGAGAAQELEVTETAFGDYGDGSWWYAIVIDNPNADAVFDYEDFTVEALDAGGASLGVEDEYLTILPGTTAVVGYFDDLGDAQIDQLEIDLPDADTGYVVDPADLGTLTVDDITATADGTYTTVSGTVTSTFADDYEDLLVYLIARNTSGDIVSVAVGSVDTITAGGTAPFQADFDPALADGDTIEAYAVL